MKAFSEQLELATRAGDPARMAATHSSIGVLLADHQELYADALPHFDESYRIDQSIGARASVGWDQINRASSLSALGRYDEARAALAEAAAIAGDPQGASTSQLASVDLIAAQMALSLGRNAEAMMRGTAALKLSEPDYKDTALQARQTLALTQAASGAPKPAVPVVDEAVRAAKDLKMPRLLSTALLASADVRVAAGDGPGALADAEAAQKMFTAAAQLESSWRAWLIAARSMRLAGNSAMAADYAARAEAGRAALAARWGDDAYRGYTRRPDIQDRLKQLAQLLAGR